MSKALLFLISFISFIVFLILMFQNLGIYSYETPFNLFVMNSNMAPGLVLALGFLCGLFVAIPMLIFVRTGGNIKISSAEKNSNEGNLEWD